jgi:glycosyltransferase involved in cell wall biosynthesis
VYIHASLGETMSTAIMQAMACGKAIVASDVDGINNMITNGLTGLLVRVQDKEQMAIAISSLITDKALRKRLETAALKTAKNTFSDRLMFLRYKKIFQ